LRCRSRTDRRTRPTSPGPDGHRFTAFLTDTDSGQLADLEARHRCHARSKTGSTPPRPQDCATWAQALCFTGQLARREPAAFRYRICAVAAKLVRTGRSWQLDRDWPWAQHLQDAFNRLRAAPWPA
jgi:hypothetical protein